MSYEALIEKNRRAKLAISIPHPLPKALRKPPTVYKFAKGPHQTQHTINKIEMAHRAKTVKVTLPTIVFNPV